MRKSGHSQKHRVTFAGFEDEASHQESEESDKENSFRAANDENSCRPSASRGGGLFAELATKTRTKY